MSLLPYTKTYVIDETRGIASATPPASFNIASLIVADTGPTERVHLRNQSDLIRYFCTGSSISADDDETIQFNGALLTQVATDVFRVDSSALRFGVGSKGSKLFFDNEYNLLEKVTKTKIVKNNQAPTCYYITLKETINDQEVSITYYVGEYADATSTDVQISENVSIKELFDGLNKRGVTLNNNETSCIFPSEVQVQGLEGSTLSGNMYNVSTKDYDSSLLYRVKAYEGDGESTSQLTVTIGKTTFYRAEDTFDTGAVESSIPLYPFKEGTHLTTDEFLVKMVDAIYKNGTIQTPWAQAIKVLVDVTKVVAEEADPLEAAEALVPSALKKYYLVIQSGEGTDARYYITCANQNVMLSYDERGVSFEGTSANDAGVVTPAALLVAVAINKYSIDPTTSEEKWKHVITDGDPADAGAPYFLYSSLTGPEVLSSNPKGIVVETSPTGYYMLKHETDETNKDYLTNSSQWVLIDDTCFYSGARKPDPEAEGNEALANVMSWVKVSGNDLSTADFLDALMGSLTTVFTVGRAPGNFYVFSGTHTFAASSNIIISNTTTIDQTDQDVFDDAFAVVCKFTSSQPLFDFEYTANDDEFHTIDVTYQFKDFTDTFTMSFDGLAVSPMGKSLYYENYNEGDNANPYIHITKLDGDGLFKNFSPDVFGNEVLNNKPTEADYSEAILKFIDERDKQYDFVCDGGHASISLAGACKQVANERFAMYAPTIPASYNKVADIKGYVESINLDDFRGVYVVPGHKNTYNGNFLSVMPGALSYIFARINAFNTTVAEFQACFGSNQGTVTAPNLIKNFKHDDAQALADLNINSIVKDIAGTYIRSNFSSQVVNSYLSEEQYAYLTNVVCHVCEEFNPTIIAKVNNSNTRQEVEQVLTGLLTQRIIAGKSPTVAGFKVICDDTDRLNTQQVIEARQLIYEVWLQYTPTVAYVKAYTYVKRLGSF